MLSQMSVTVPAQSKEVVYYRAPHASSARKVDGGRWLHSLLIVVISQQLVSSMCHVRSQVFIIGWFLVADCHCDVVEHSCGNDHWQCVVDVQPNSIFQYREPTLEYAVSSLDAVAGGGMCIVVASFRRCGRISDWCKHVGSTSIATVTNQVALQCTSLKSCT